MRRLITVLILLAAVSACSKVVDGQPVSNEAGLTLTQKWRVQVDGAGQDPHRIVGGSADAQRLYVSDLAGQVWALDARTGRTDWTRVVGQRTGTAVVQNGGVVWFYDTDRGLFVLDPATGRTLWTVPDNFVAPNVFLPPVSGTGLTLIDDEKLTAVSVRTGKPVWSRDNIVAAKPELIFDRDQGATDGSRFFVTARGDDVEQATVLALNAANGKTLWTRPLPSRSSDAVLMTVPGLVLVAISPDSDHGIIYAYDTATGAPKWQAAIPAPYDTHPSLRVGNQLLVPSTGRSFSVVALATGKVSTWGQGDGGAVVGNCLGHPCTGNSDGVRVYDTTGTKITQLAVPKESLIADPVTGPAGETYLVGGTYVYRYG